MTTDDRRASEYDPEASGLPGTFDPDSSAFDEQESVREADGPDPSLWPDGRPLALDESGANGTDASTLDELLAREVPDTGAEPVVVDDAADDSDHSDSDDSDSDDSDSEDMPDPYAEDEVEDAGTFTGTLEADDAVDDYYEDAPVGRLTEPDDDGGRHNPTFASDVGMAGGGASAEEAAMHVVDLDDPEADV
jgi:Family of unknown function (DUF5709)